MGVRVNFKVKVQKGCFNYTRGKALCTYLQCFLCHHASDVICTLDVNCWTYYLIKVSKQKSQQGSEAFRCSLVHSGYGAICR